MPFEVYCHTSPDGKKYIGCTSKGWQERWSGHISMARTGSPAPLHRAIREYGQDAFTHVVLAVLFDKGQACWFERQMIASMRTRAPLGYNVRTDNSEYFECHSEAARAKMSAARTGVPRSREAVERSAAGLRGKPSPRRGKPLSQAHRDNVSAGQCLRHFKRKVKAAWLIAEMSF